MNRKLYLIVFSSKIDRQELVKIFDAAPGFFWFYNLPNSIFIKSSLSSKEIYEKIEPLTGEERCIITEVPANVYGRLPKDHWELFKDK